MVPERCERVYHVTLPAIRLLERPIPLEGDIARVDAKRPRVLGVIDEALKCLFRHPSGGECDAQRQGDQTDPGTRRAHRAHDTPRGQRSWTQTTGEDLEDAGRNCEALHRWFAPTRCV